MSKLFIVATPIGNLKDITLRAIETLQTVDYILAENTSKARNLLSFYNIKKPVLNYFQGSDKKTRAKIFDLLKKEKDIALISEAGTPGLSDPGNELIAEIIEKFGDRVEIIPVPGPSALTTIASIAGLPMQKFLFLGFVPKRKQRKIFQEIVSSKYPVVFFESPYRIIKTLEKLQELEPNLQVVVGRELTKKFETIYRGTLEEVIKSIKKDKIKGEFVVVVCRI